jgi:hypothetical protein
MREKPRQHNLNILQVKLQSIQKWIKEITQSCHNILIHIELVKRWAEVKKDMVEFKLIMNAKKVFLE